MYVGGMIWERGGKVAGTKVLVSKKQWYDEYRCSSWPFIGGGTIFSLCQKRRNRIRVDVQVTW